jgi:PIN domain nuclease of toxin-antitoxin system
MVERSRGVCIDTHALIWYLSKPKRLGRAAARRLRLADSGRCEVLIPAVVPVELTLLREAGRSVVGPAEVEALSRIQPAFRLVPLDIEQALDFGHLAGLGDPFDRLVVACARTSSVPLVTADARIHESALVDVIWD